MGGGCLPAVQSDPSGGQSLMEMKSELISDAITDLVLFLCMFMVAQGLSGRRGGANGRSDHDLSVAPAGGKRAVPGHRTEGAGKE